jgi:capsule polysaccharide export protein KpsE/RkpR
MQNDNKLFEDLSKVATAALGTLAGAGKEIQEQARQRARDFVGAGGVDPDAVAALQALVSGLKTDVAALQADVAALKAALASQKAGG